MTNISTATPAELRKTLRAMRAENVDASTQLDLIHADIIGMDPVTFEHNGGNTDQEQIVTIRKGRLMIRCLAKNAARTAAKLRSASKTPTRRAVTIQRSFPKFEAGMSTADYVRQYAIANNGGYKQGAELKTLSYNLADYRNPCTLYEGNALDFEPIEQPADAPDLAAEALQPVSIVSELTGATMATVPRHVADQVSELIASATTAAEVAAQAMTKDQAEAVQMHGQDWDGRELCGYYISEKLDGCRAYWDGAHLYTKTGNIINAPSITATLPAGFAMDGEIYAGRGRFEDARLFVQHGKHPERVQFIAFDAPSEAGKDWPARLQAIRAHGVPCVDCVQAGTMGDVLHALTAVLDAGGEGLMARRAGTAYKPGRSHNLLKLKAHSLAYFEDAHELAPVDAEAEADALATTCDAGNAGNAGSAPIHGHASSSAHQAPTRPTHDAYGQRIGQRVAGNSGNWCAVMFTDDAGRPSFEFDGPDGSLEVWSFATGRERMAALQAMAREADELASAVDDDDDSPDAWPLDPMTATAADVQALSAAEFGVFFDRLEDINFHGECLLLRTLRAGRDDLAERARANIRAHLAAGHLAPELSTERQAIDCELTASEADQAPATYTPSATPAPAGGYQQPAPVPKTETEADTEPADNMPRAVAFDSGPQTTASTDTADTADNMPRAVADDSAPEFTRTAAQPFDMLAMMAAGIAPADFVGLGIVYSGDRANPSGRGAITNIEPCGWYKWSVTVTLDDGRVSVLNPISFTDGIGNRFKTDFKRHGAPYLAELRAARLAVEAARKASETAAADEKARQRRELPQQWPQLKAYDPAGKLSGCTLAASNIRVLLKEQFPGIKFSVRCDKFSGGDAIDISWVDGPSAKAVEAISNRFEAGSFNGMDDIYEYAHSVFKDLFGDAKYIHVNRRISDDLLASAITLEYPNADARPSVEDYRQARGEFHYIDGRHNARRIEERLNSDGWLIKANLM